MRIIRVIKYFNVSSVSGWHWPKVNDKWWNTASTIIIFCSYAQRLFKSDTINISCKHSNMSSCWPKTFQEVSVTSIFFWFWQIGISNTLCTGIQPYGLCIFVLKQTFRDKLHVINVWNLKNRYLNFLFCSWDTNVRVRIP